ncbi:hypothetical protein DBR17_09825 [Sphingomonas sp. HMWF008]|nr:hypothetical protein DBR17_09825 [Sphingomonas sp. HMWF008]
MKDLTTMNDQKLDAAIRYAVTASKRCWNTPVIIESDLGSTQKSAAASEFLDLTNNVSRGPS